MLMDLIALYNYDPTLLSTFALPESLEDKRDVLIPNLLMESAERELIYPDPNFLKAAIGAWSQKQSPVWDELYATTQYEYNPIWNVDGTVVEDRDLAATKDSTINVDREDKLQDKDTRDLDDEHKNYVYGFNSSTEAPSDKSTIDYNGTDTVDHTGTQDVDTTIDEDTTDTGTITTTRTGNIGVTTTQQMIREQRALVEYNILDVIIKDFMNRFCLKVY